MPASSTDPDHIEEARAFADARYDPPRNRFIPDRELVARVHNALLESESQRQAFIRQHWETACAGVRVALDALREIYPTDNDAMSGYVEHAIGETVNHLTDALIELTNMSADMLGGVMFDVQRGVITTIEDLEARL
jgi:hypothetical protein